MKCTITAGIVCCLLAVTVAALADSYITVPNTGERLYKWDGQYLMKPNTGERLFKWDGQYVMNPNTGGRLFKWDGQYLMNPNTGARDRKSVV